MPATHSCGCRAAGAWNSGLPMSGSWMKATRRSQKRRLPRSASASRSLLKFSLAASRISLLGPKLLVFNSPGKGLTLTAPPVSSEASEPAGPSAWESGEPLGEAPYADLAAKERMRDAAGSVQNAQPMAERFNPAPLLSRLFTALKARGGASSALERIGVKNAQIYFASEKGVSTWRIDDFHIDLEEGGSESALRGELTLGEEGSAWRASFRAVNQPASGLYSLTASISDIVPRTIWQSFPIFDALKLADLPVSGEARFDISHEGMLVGGEGEIKLGSGKFFVGPSIRIQPRSMAVSSRFPTTRPAGRSRSNPSSCAGTTAC